MNLITMKNTLNDDELCRSLIQRLSNVFPDLIIKGGAEEPFYEAPKGDAKAILYFRSNYPRSLLHELCHYCLSGEKRRQLDDFGYWYYPCGRTADEQLLFEQVEARPQGLEKLMCEIVGITFIPSLDDFSGRPASEDFLSRLNQTYEEMRLTPPPTVKKALTALATIKNYN
ncbi:elongation factor P hydroxylase [Orbus wheelerorum]|uniref:elongation factor P hydroxylase n=1 Tax=Orbus wheelerorum TaxID=3074111 RepID=UPI00370D97A2